MPPASPPTTTTLPLVRAAYSDALLEARRRITALTNLPATVTAEDQRRARYAAVRATVALLDSANHWLTAEAEHHQADRAAPAAPAAPPVHTQSQFDQIPARREPTPEDTMRLVEQAQQRRERARPSARPSAGTWPRRAS